MIRVEKAELRDSEEIGKLFFEVFSPIYQKLFKYHLKESTSSAISRLYISNADMFIAKDKNKIVGFASSVKSIFSLWKNPINIVLPSRYLFIAPVRLRDFGKPLFLTLGVDESYRGRGIGVQLTNRIEKNSKEQGVVELFAQIHLKNELSKKLLINTGWSLAAKQGFLLLFKKKL